MNNSHEPRQLLYIFIEKGLHCDLAQFQISIDNLSPALLQILEKFSAPKQATIWRATIYAPLFEHHESGLFLERIFNISHTN